MRSFQEYICEGYVNAVGTRGTALRQKYGSAVWNLLNRTYSKIGGIRGSGFSSVDDMIANIPFWKLYIKNGVLLVAVLYKDKGGRKAVALEKILKNDFSVSYGEYSKALLTFIIKRIPRSVIEPLMRLPAEAEAILRKDVTAVSGEFPQQLDAYDARTLRNYPQYAQYFYVREIGGKPYLKLMIGTPGIKIT